ncbi:MAG: hypothetical protein AAF624_12560 [Bacteroidota bacterium]
MSDLPIPSTSDDLVLLGLYVGSALALSLYVYTAFIAPRVGKATKPDFEATTRDVLARHRARELHGHPDYLLPGERSALTEDPTGPRQDAHR